MAIPVQLVTPVTNLWRKMCHCFLLPSCFTWKNQLERSQSLFSFFQATTNPTLAFFAQKAAYQKTPRNGLWCGGPTGWTSAVDPRLTTVGRHVLPPPWPFRGAVDGRCKHQRWHDHPPWTPCGCLFSEHWKKCWKKPSCPKSTMFLVQKTLETNKQNLRCNWRHVFQNATRTWLRRARISCSSSGFRNSCETFCSLRQRKTAMIIKQLLITSRSSVTFINHLIAQM